MARPEVRHLSLVRPIPVPSTGSAIPPGQKSQSESWRQLDLFAANPHTVVFVAPEECKFIDVVNLLETAHIRQVFDMREVPHLVFEGHSRAAFFDVLDELGVSYMSSLEYETKYEGNAEMVLARELSRKLRTGPTMVFSNREPETDPEVAKIDENFTKEVKGYQSVFFSTGTR